MKKIFFLFIIAGLAFVPMQTVFAGGPSGANDRAGNNCQFNKNEKVMVNWKGKWYKAKILKVNDDCTRYYIHYIGWSSSWDEWVTPERISVGK